MYTTKITLPKITIIGREGSSEMGGNFVQELWTEANKNFAEIEHLAKWNADGSLAGIWGAMTDFSRSFMPWEHFKNGLYLAGIEAVDDAVAPAGWTKWVLPSFEYVKAEVNSTDTFKEVIGYLIANKIELVGAVQDFTDPKSQKNYMLFPIRKID